MKKLAVLLTLIAGCGHPPPPAPPPAPPPPPAPVRIPTLAIETRYTPDLTLTLRLDGAPASGEVSLVPLADAGFQGSPGDLDDVPEREYALTLEPAATGEAGVYVAPASGLARLTVARSFAVVVAGRRYPYPQPFGTNAGQCAASLAALRRLDACTARLPTLAAAPTVCDDAGVLGFQAVVAELDGRYEACWASASDEAVARLERLDAPDLVMNACQRLVAKVGPAVETPLGMRMVPTCAPFFDESTRARLLRARRTADLPAALEKAQRGDSNAMRQFYADYAITEDPRVEDLRKLAMERFGPRKRAQFLATRKALFALDRDGWEAVLCTMDSTHAELVVLRGARRTSEGPLDDESQAVADNDRSAERVTSPSRCGPLARMVMMPPSRRRPPDGFTARAEALVRARTGLRDVRWVGSCGVDHWYFDQEPKPKSKATPR